MELNSSQEWDRVLESHPDAHLLQTSAWGKLKANFGWQTAWVSTPDHKIAAQILVRQFGPGIKMAYIPKGPVSQIETESEPIWDNFWLRVDETCRKLKVAFLKVEPDIWVTRETIPKNKSEPETENKLIQHNNRLIPFKNGFKLSSHAIQPTRTILLDIHGSEEEILGRMKQKTRYNIRLAAKQGVSVKESDNIEKFHKLMAITGIRDQFGIHSFEYFSKANQLFAHTNACRLLMAEHEGDMLAGLLVFQHGRRAWYLYGASSDQKRNLMPAYAVQWEAIRWARSLGCLEYDLWGVPDFDLNTLEENFQQLSGHLWGVYRFKRGFGGDLCQSSGAFDRVYNPIVYGLYRLRTSIRASTDL
jgi:peptidoglycan pentaglycine glycine transferase (the first glycine)